MARVAAETQPFPLKPPPFARQIFTEEWSRTVRRRRTPRSSSASARCAARASSCRPASRHGRFPGFDGGGGVGRRGLRSGDRPALRECQRNGVDPAAGRTTEDGKARPARSLYIAQLRGLPSRGSGGHAAGVPVAGGHRRAAHRRAKSPPSIRQGDGRMPAFAQLPRSQLDGDHHLSDHGRRQDLREPRPSPWPIDQKYGIDGYNKFLDPDGYPAVEPPWGTLNAIDLNTGEDRLEDSVRRISRTGREGHDATPAAKTTADPVVTAGGLLFIGATNHDRKFHAFDKATGKLLWETLCPPRATPLPRLMRRTDASTWSSPRVAASPAPHPAEPMSPSRYHVSDSLRSRFSVLKCYTLVLHS